jgi:hypothetical protein
MAEPKAQHRVELDADNYTKDYKNICDDNALVESMFELSESDAKYSIYEDDNCLNGMLVEG